MKDRLFEYTQDSQYKGEYKKGDDCIILGFTYQDCGPVVWCAHAKTGRVIGSNPTHIKTKYKI